MSGITALEHSASVSFGSNSQPAAAWEELGQASHGAGGGDGALGAPSARGSRGVAFGDTEPGVNSATAPPLPPLRVLSCLRGRKSWWGFRK